MGSITFTIQANNVADAKQLAMDLAETLAGMKTSDIPLETTVSTLETEAAAREVAAAAKESAPAADLIPDAVQVNIPTAVELRAKAQEKGKTPEAKKAIKALLDGYGCKSISDVPEDKRSAFMAALESL